MSFVLINYAPDGIHISAHNTATAALAALAAMLGRSTDDCGDPLRVGHAYYSDWGNRLVVEERGPGHTAQVENELRAAFDARECGIATPQKLALLEKHRW
jgi:hypothetical protein